MMKRTCRFFADSSGAVLVEALFVIPVLILLTFGTVQIGVIYYVMNSMSEITREGARAFATQVYDDETGGTLTSCAAMTGMAASGLPSVEAFICERASILPGSYTVSASDGAIGELAASGTTVTIRLQIDRSQVIVYDPFSTLLGAETLSSTAVNIVE